jgi:hypothetical protein
MGEEKGEEGVGRRGKGGQVKGTKFKFLDLQRREEDFSRVTGV